MSPALQTTDNLPAQPAQNIHSEDRYAFSSGNASERFFSAGFTASRRWFSRWGFLDRLLLLGRELVPGFADLIRS